MSGGMRREAREASRAGGAEERPLVVVHVTGGTRTGCTRVVLNLVQEADRVRFAPRVCLFSVVPADPEVLDELHAMGVPCLEVQKRSRYELGAVDRLARALVRLGAEAVVLHGFGAYSVGALAARLAGVRTVVRLEHSPELYGPHHRAVSALTARWVEATFAVSRSLLDSLRQAGTPLLNPVVVPNGVELAPLVAIARAPFEGSRYAEGAHPVVLMVARLDVAKDHDTLLCAAALLRTRGRPVRLQLAGVGPLEAELRRHALALGLDVEFLGHRTDLAALWEQADIGVLSTRYEGFGLAVVEAMAAGRPVVATRVAALPELVDDGIEGLLVPPRDAVALADALESLVDKPEWAGKLGAQGRARALAQYALIPSVRRFEEALLEVVADTRRGV